MHKKKKKRRKIYISHLTSVSCPIVVMFQLPLALFGGAGNYASALYLASVKANVLDKVESELVDLAEASKKSPLFSQFAKDLSVKKDVRLKAINDICAQAKLSDITKNFLGMVSCSLVI